MLTSLFHYLQKTKRFLYLCSIGILSCFSAWILFRSVTDTTGIDFLKTVLSGNTLTFVVLSGSLLLLCFFFLVLQHLSAYSDQRLQRLTCCFAALGIFLQFFVLCYFRPVLRYDHLMVFDGALEILETGNLSLSASNGYFGNYPFNISITVFESFILRVFQFFRISQDHFMLLLQCAYLLLIDLGVFFAWKILRMFHAKKTAAFFVILCFFNPILYACAAGCYTTTLMVPLLMGSLYLILSFSKETKPKKKWLLGFFAGFVLAFGTRLRATVLIAGIAWGIYMLIRESSSASSPIPFRQKASLLFAVLFGFLISFGGFTAIQNSYITEDYKDTQMPAMYYLMFAANPETKGTYNERDHQQIAALDTLEEKNKVSFETLKTRLKTMGVSGMLSLADHKLQLTWCDGTDDYSDFLITSRNYSRLHSFLAGGQKDFFAIYCHIFHVTVMIAFLYAVLLMLKRPCTSYYLVFLTLLGGIVFHLFWEAYYIYSFGFSMLLLIGASDGCTHFSQRFASRKRILGTGIGTLTLFTLGMLFCISIARTSEFKGRNDAVVQDMSNGSLEPLLTGDSISQTFRTKHPFDHIAVKIFNPFGEQNQAVYHFELLASDGSCLHAQDFSVSAIPDKDYCYFEMVSVVPAQMEAYTIRITPVYTSSKDYVTFAYYHTQHYDIYADGAMTGLNSDARSDLTFLVFESTAKTFLP